MGSVQKIVVVDDDEDFCDQVCTYFKMNGFEADGFSNPNVALDHLRSNQYDLLITDYFMPPIDGFEFIRQLREFEKKMKVLLISAYSTLNKEIVSNLKIMGYLHKPLNLELIVNRIREL